MEIQQLEERVENLEMKLSFQDDTIEQLNNAIIEQHKILADQKVQLSFLINRVKTMQVGSGLASEADETPPPHY